MRRFSFPIPSNEPVLQYAPASLEKKTLKATLAELKSREIEIPLVIGGRLVKTGRLADCRPPHEHALRLGRYHQAGPAEAAQASAAALKAGREWARMPFSQRASVFLKAAELLAGPWRPVLNAASMHIQSKNVFQAEIDAACELIDFWRFNVYFAEQIHAMQPLSPRGVWNRMEHRPLEGFVFAITPFNFTSIAGNLPTAPALMGNTVVWKPASSTVYTAYFILQLLQEAGLPNGVINMVAGPGEKISPPILNHPHLAGIHFTGSTSVFQNLWSAVGSNIRRYRTYPRLVGETGGKDFVIAHPSADWEALATALIRGAFEYQGQKCSAASRAYIPRSLWPKLKERLREQMAELRMGGVEDFRNFINAVIDRSAFRRIQGYIQSVRRSREARLIFGGSCQDKVGYFIQPALVETRNPRFTTMCEEIFGPVLTVYVYSDSRYEEALRLCDETSPYGLTGAVFSRDRKAVLQASQVLTHAAGNFYINDKPTGAVVAQQPFGGSRASGTNDKAGSLLNLLRWVSPRTIKETFAPPKNYRYPFLEAP